MHAELREHVQLEVRTSWRNFVLVTQAFHLQQDARLVEHVVEPVLERIRAWPPAPALEL
jgi:hypothetical protein